MKFGFLKKESEGGGALAADNRVVTRHQLLVLAHEARGAGVLVLLRDVSHGADVGDVQHLQRV